MYPFLRSTPASCCVAPSLGPPAARRRCPAPVRRRSSARSRERLGIRSGTRPGGWCGHGRGDVPNDARSIRLQRRRTGRGVLGGHLAQRARSRWGLRPGERDCDSGTAFQSRFAPRHGVPPRRCATATQLGMASPVEFGNELLDTVGVSSRVARTNSTGCPFGSARPQSMYRFRGCTGTRLHFPSSRSRPPLCDPARQRLSAYGRMPRCRFRASPRRLRDARHLTLFHRRRRHPGQCPRSARRFCFQACRCDWACRRCPMQ